jgi:transglutaminase-like putative cysteine protease
VRKTRALTGGAIIVAWIVGLAFLIHRTYFRPQLERLAEGAGRVAPGAVYYGVMQGDRQVGFASSTIDTTQGSIIVTDYLVADLPVGGKSRRTTARTNVRLSRTLHMRTFDFSLEGEGAPIRAGGRIDGDSVMVFAIGTGAGAVDSQRVALTGPVFLPTLVPLAAAITARPKVGKHYVIPVLDPARLAPSDVRIDVRAESLIVVHDSSAYDSTTGRWHGVLPDTIRSWWLSADSGRGFSGWIDEQGHVMAMSQLGFELRRMPYEVAFENWRNDTTRAAVTDDRDLLETTAIAANKRMTARIDGLRVRLTGVPLDGFDLNGQRQRLSGDTLVVIPQPEGSLLAGRQIPYRDRDASTAQAEPLIQSNNPQIVKLAQRIRAGERDPEIVARRINQWVHDSISDRVTFGVPSALQVLASRTGDCNEHTQLFVALARSVGIPSRVAAGLAYVDGKFYYHAWPEILLRDWVPVDPTFGQFPADAAHLRFVIGGIARQTELLRLMGTLKIDVISVNGGPASGGPRGRK